MLRWVRMAAGTPQKCALLPHLGANAAGGYFTTGSRCTICDGHHYVSVEAAKQMAAKLGFQPAGHVPVAERKLEETEARLSAALDRIVQLEEEAAAVRTLVRAGYEAKRPPGRPKGSAKKAPVEVAV